MRLGKNLARNTAMLKSLPVGMQDIEGIVRRAVVDRQDFESDAVLFQKTVQSLSDIPPPRYGQE